MEYIAQSLLKYQKNQLEGQKNQDFNLGSQQKNLGSIKILSVLELNLPPKGDISDWLEAGHTKEELLAIVENTPEFVKENARKTIIPLQ